MTARTLYALPGPLQLTPSQLGRYGRFKLTSRTLETIRAELWTDAGADVVEVTNPGDSVAFPLLGLRAVHLSASGYPAHVLLESTELPLALDCAPQIGNTLTNPMPVTTGGGPGACMFETPFTPPSPVDLLGGMIDGTGTFIPRVPVYPSVATVLSGPFNPYGVANNNSFGISAGVWGPVTVAVDWSFDLGAARHVCTAELKKIGGIPLEIELLADGVTVVAAGGWGVLPAIALSPAAFGSVYTIRYSHAHLGGYYAGLDMNGLLLWPLGL